MINVFVFKALTSGTNLHLTENELLRGVFEMGAPIPSLSSVQGNISKHQRVRFNKLQCTLRLLYINLITIALVGQI